MLDHAHGHPVFEPAWVVGSAFQATLAFYPSAHPRRALLADPPTAADPARFPHLDAEQPWAELATALAAQPWQTPLPLALGAMRPQRDTEGWCLRTATDGRLAVTLNDAHGWQLLALGGGGPLDVFGEWDGERLRVLSAWTDTLAWSEP